MRFPPKSRGYDQWIQAALAPPCSLVTVAVNLTMMSTAERDGEFVADLAPERAMLGKANVVCICGLPSADQAGLRRDELQVAVAKAARLRKRQDAFIDTARRR